jgi:hypothetical protein
MKLVQSPLSIFEKAVILKLSIGHPGNTAKLGKDKYEVKAGTSEDASAEASAKAKARTKAEKKLIEAPEVDEAVKDLEQCRQKIRKISNASPLGDGSRLISIVAVPKGEQIITDTLTRLEDVHKPRIADLRPQRIAEAKRDLNGLFNPADYDPTDEFLRKFYIEQQYLSFGAPAALAQVGLLLREEDKINAAALETARSIPVDLAVEMQKFTKELMARTTKSAGGAKVQFKGLLDGYLEFLANLPLRNVLDTEELREAGEKALSVLTGVSSEALIENPRIRDYVENEMSGVASKLDTIINLRPTRAFEAA